MSDDGRVMDCLCRTTNGTLLARFLFVFLLFSAVNGIAVSNFHFSLIHLLLLVERCIIGVNRYCCYCLNINYQFLNINIEINPLGTDLFEKIFACGTDLIFGCLE